MSDSVVITVIICASVVIVSIIGYLKDSKWCRRAYEL